METSSTFSVIYLGNLPSVDPEEGMIYDGYYYESAEAENADALSGMTFENLTQDSLQTWSADSFESDDPSGDVSTYNQDSTFAGTDTFNITDADGVTTTHGFDAVVVYQATITYADGSQSTGEIVVAQDTEGNTWVVPPSTYTPDAEMLDGDIKAIEIIKPTGTAASGLYYQRAVLNDIGTVPCFCPGTFLETPDGPRAIESLQAGDLVLTRDRGAQEIRWIGERVVPAEVLATSPALGPVLIEKGALSENSPVHDLLVSPQHRILLRSRVVQRMLNTGEVLVPAAALTAVSGISRVSMNATVRYYHVLFDHHEVVLANGAETESLFPGPVALASVGPRNFLRIVVSCPHILDQSARPISARTIVKGRKARKLAQRHEVNGRLLVEDATRVFWRAQRSPELRSARCPELLRARPRVSRPLRPECALPQSALRVAVAQSELPQTARFGP